MNCGELCKLTNWFHHFFDEGEGAADGMVEAVHIEYEQVEGSSLSVGSLLVGSPKSLVAGKLSSSTETPGTYKWLVLLLE